MKYYSENTHAFKLEGKDAKDFLQRISTNDIRNLNSLGSIRTAFLNEKGRLIDFCHLILFNNDLYLICSAGNSEQLKNHIEKYIIMDDVGVSDFEALKTTYIHENDEEFKALEESSGLKDVIFFKDNFRFEKHISVEIETEQEMLKEIRNNSIKISEEDFRKISIENGYVYDTNEINDSINPLECLLKEYISFTKGCYIGQEVIARLDSQEKLPKIMVKILSENELNKGDLIYFNENTTESESGFVSSAAGKETKYEGLGFIRYSNLSNDYNYYINKDKNNSISIIKLV